MANSAYVKQIANGNGFRRRAVFISHNLMTDPSRQGIDDIKTVVGSDRERIHSNARGKTSQDNVAQGRATSTGAGSSKARTQYGFVVLLPLLTRASENRKLESRAISRSRCDSPKREILYAEVKTAIFHSILAPFRWHAASRTCLLLIEESPANLQHNEAGGGFKAAAGRR